MIATGKLDDAYNDKMLPLLKEEIENHYEIYWYFDETEASKASE